MEILYVILGIVILGPIISSIFGWLDKLKERRRKAREYPILQKEIRDKDALILKCQKENDKLVAENKFLSEKNEQIVSHSKELTSQLEVAQLKLRENAALITNLQNSKDEFAYDNSELSKSIIELEETINRLTSELEIYHKDVEKANQRISEIKQERDDFRSGLQEQHELHTDVENRSNASITKITSLYSDYLLIEYDIIARYLENKKRPAIIEGKRIRELKQESKLHLEKYRQMMYKFEYLLNIFPELSTYVDDFESLKQLEDANSINDFKEEYDKVRDYISKEEYRKLSTDDKNQLALDNYIKRPKTNWQIGRDYELFCGQEYEKDGWNVSYFGMEQKLVDLGRDLIAIKNNRIHIVQCKFWSQRKVIHEKHIMQLYGSTVAYAYDKDLLWDEILPVFMTNTELSKTATIIADKLGVKVVKKDMAEFPRIKCNIGKDEYGFETKIYHLPFDQQYDRTRIKQGQGFFAHDVKTAVSKGYRRAYKYFGE